MNGQEGIQPEENLESTESTERVKEQALQEVTHEPEARVEQTQEYTEAEAVEGALTKAVQSVEEVSATPITLPKEDGGPKPEAESGRVALSPDDVKEDVETQVTSGESGHPGKDVAVTPINLPYVADEVEGGEGDRPGGDVAATPINLPYVADEVEGGQGGRPGGDVADDPTHGPNPIMPLAETDDPPEPEGPNSGKLVGEQPQLANFEKPILNEQLERDGLGQEGLEDLDGMMPKPGGIEGGPGEGDKQEWWDNMPGGKGPGSGQDGNPNNWDRGPGAFEGGPENLTNDPGGEEPPPEGFPDHSEVMEGSGFHSYKSETGRWLTMKSMKDDTPGSVQEPDGKSHWEAGKDGWYQQDHDDEDPPDKKGGKKKASFEEDGTGKTAPITAGSNPDFNDQDEISTQTADDMQGGDPAGKDVLPQHQEKLKDIARKEMVRKLAGPREKKAGAELVTDPPEYDAKSKKKSESTGKT